MKRREFLQNTVGVAGAMLPGAVLGQAAPCPPQTVGIAGGTSAATACTVGSAAADWQARSTGPGVVWAEDFRNANAFNKFLIRAWDRPNDLTIDTNDGILGQGALHIHCEAGSNVRSKWMRPMCAFPAGSGTWTWTGGYGSIAPQPWTTPADIGYTRGMSTGNPDGLQYTQPGSLDNSYWHLYRYGLHGHSDYWNDTRFDPNTTPWEWAKPGGKTSAEFWVQYRAKLSPSFFEVDTFTGGARTKHAWIDLAGASYHEIISVLPGEAIIDDGGTQRTKRHLFLYTNRNGVDLATMKPGETYIAPGSAWANTCTRGSGPNTCWEAPIGEWYTMLFHVIPGRHNPQMPLNTFYPENYYDACPYKDTTVEVWAHRKGESGYTQLFSMSDIPMAFASNYESGTNGPKGYNVITFDGYASSANQISTRAWDTWYDQIIFSHEFIPCPNDGMG